MARMRTKIIKTPLSNLVTVDIEYFKDERGFLIESWHKRDFKKAGLDLTFMQEIQSGSKHKVLRGLHYQDMSAPLGKLIRCIYGKAFCVAVDLRTKSPTFSKWFAIELSAKNKKQLYVPVGFAFGFTVLSEFADLLYKFTGFYTPSAEKILLWNDEELSISWPNKKPILSKRDAQGITFAQYKKDPSFS